MGNPHAVQFVDDVDAALVAGAGPGDRDACALSAPRQRRLHAQVLSRAHPIARARARRRRATLACGTGACAAVVAGIRLGWAGDAKVDVDDARRRAHHRWAGGDSRVHDGARRHRLRGRDRTVSIQGITEQDIANSSPTTRLLRAQCRAARSIQLTSPHGQRAVSLQERQMEMLREKIKGPGGQDHRDDPPRPGERGHRRPAAPLDARADAHRRARPICRVLTRELMHQFMIPQSGIRCGARLTPSLRSPSLRR